MENGKYTIKATFTFENFDAEDLQERIGVCKPAESWIDQPVTLFGTTFYDGNPLNVYIGTSTLDPA